MTGFRLKKVKEVPVSLRLLVVGERPAFYFARFVEMAGYFILLHSCQYLKLPSHFPLQQGLTSSNAMRF
jgi:hypothetical protein